MPRSTETFLAYCCSVSGCDETYPTERRCQQHCSQPHSACNRGRSRHEFATPVPIRVRVEGHRGRIVGGQVTRTQDAGQGRPRRTRRQPDTGNLRGTAQHRWRRRCSLELGRRRGAGPGRFLLRYLEQIYRIS